MSYTRTYKDRPNKYSPIEAIGSSFISLENESLLAEQNFKKNVNILHGIAIDSSDILCKGKYFKNPNNEISMNNVLDLFPQNILNEYLVDGKQVFSVQQEGPNSLSSDSGYTTSQDGFLGILLFYMKCSVLKILKSDLTISSMNYRLFRMVCRECKEDFMKDFYKIIFMASKAVLEMMEELFTKTGYIYPIALPSLQVAGKYYRASMTSILPSAVFYYLQELPLRTILDRPLIEKFYEKAKKDSSEEMKQEIDDKLQTLDSFLPSFLGKNIVIENSMIMMKIKTVRVADESTWAHVVDTEYDLLFKSCKSIIKTIFEIEKMYQRELGGLFTYQEPECMKQVPSISLLYREFRFKPLYENINSVFIVQKLSQSGIWENIEVVKQCQDQKGFSSELGYSRCKRFSRRGLLIINPLFEPVEKVEQDQAKIVLEILAKELDILHERNWVHCDIKPAHIMIDRSQENGFRLIDFENSAFSCDPVSGYTLGYQPPEYDCLLNGDDGCARLESDVFSLGLTFLDLMFNCGIIDRERIPDFLNQVQDVGLREVLRKMLELDFEKRLKDASEIIKELNKLK